MAQRERESAECRIICQWLYNCNCNCILLIALHCILVLPFRCIPTHWSPWLPACTITFSIMLATLLSTAGNAETYFQLDILMLISLAHTTHTHTYRFLTHGFSCKYFWFSFHMYIHAYVHRCTYIFMITFIFEADTFSCCWTFWVVYFVFVCDLFDVLFGAVQTNTLNPFDP